MNDPDLRDLHSADKRLFADGQVSEWFKELVLKTSEGVSSPWVRIPPCPPIYFSGCSFAPDVTLSPKAAVIESTTD